MEAEQWPPVRTDETEAERSLRVEEEREAKKISDAIDRSLERERQDQLKRKRKQVKVLLLGQAESGKSTMLKNFQMYFAPKAFRAELVLWRAVIHLNLVRSVNFILDLLSSDEADDQARRKSHDELRFWTMHLAPLRQAETILQKCLTGSSLTSSDSTDPLSMSDEIRLPDVSIKCGSAWKELVRDQLKQAPSRRREGLDDAQQILDACRDHIVSLWTSDKVQEPLRQRGVELRGQPGFFLDEADRVASISYVPTIEDVLRARIRTGGVEEHQIISETTFEKNHVWSFYDVAGARGQRAAWAPFFDDATAIIFLCPMDGFDLTLSEDPKFNRLIDSMRLWKTVCESKALEKTSFIMLLNKRDVLELKLQSGTSFAKYIPQFEGKNEVHEVIRYIKSVMGTLYRQHSPTTARRQLHAYVTCAIDVNAMSQVLAAVRDVIVMNSLESSSLL